MNAVSSRSHSNRSDCPSPARRTRGVLTNRNPRISRHIASSRPGLKIVSSGTVRSRCVRSSGSLPSRSKRSTSAAAVQPELGNVIFRPYGLRYSPVGRYTPAADTWRVLLSALGRLHAHCTSSNECSKPPPLPIQASVTRGHVGRPGRSNTVPQRRRVGSVPMRRFSLQLHPPQDFRVLVAAYQSHESA